jgi:hypothetical protein
MSMELAVRYAEIILACALLIQGFEYVRYQRDLLLLHWARLLLSVVLLLGVQPLWVESFLLLISIRLVIRFQGPYNGGSDSMTLLVLLCLWLFHIAPNQKWQEIVLGYLTVQSILSYFQAGWVKLINPDWRSGVALQQVFSVTAYPVSESVRQFSRKQSLIFYMSWAVIVFELIFPLAIFSEYLLYLFLLIAVSFHLANAFLFGLNRFFWIWPATYPVLIWFQGRVF